MTLFAVGLMLGLLAGLILAAFALVHFDRLENPNPWTSSDQWTTTTETEYAPQRDDVLGRILADIERELLDDPRQSARDSATSARSKTFRG